jgi:hypothetical protein
VTTPEVLFLQSRASIDESASQEQTDGATLRIRCFAGYFYVKPRMVQPLKAVGYEYKRGHLWYIIQVGVGQLTDRASRSEEPAAFRFLENVADERQ